MTGEPIASGREADVYALDQGRVLRRYRGGGDAAGEAEVMAYAGGLGYPVPRVHDVSGPDMVLERLDGPTMAAAFLAGDLPGEEGMRILADLLRRLHTLPGPRTIVHLDLHPENVMLTARGPVVIDWRNARDGEPDLDTGLTGLILAQLAVGSIEHELGHEADGLLDLFLEIAPGDPLRLLDEVVAFRAGQLTLSPAEIGTLAVAAARMRRVA